MTEQKQVRKKSEGRMKVALTQTLAGPEGTAKPGTVLDLPESVAKDWIDRRFARTFDKERDAKAPIGLTVASRTEQ